MFEACFWAKNGGVAIDYFRYRRHRLTIEYWGGKREKTSKIGKKTYKMTKKRRKNEPKVRKIEKKVTK